MAIPTEPIGSMPRPNGGSTRTSGRTRFTDCRIPRQTASRSRSVGRSRRMPWLTGGPFRYDKALGFWQGTEIAVDQFVEHVIAMK